MDDSDAMPHAGSLFEDSQSRSSDEERSAEYLCDAPRAGGGDDNGLCGDEGRVHATCGRHEWASAGSYDASSSSGGSTSGEDDVPESPLASLSPARGYGDDDAETDSVGADVYIDYATAVDAHWRALCVTVGAVTAPEGPRQSADAASVAAPTMPTSPVAGVQQDPREGGLNADDHSGPMRSARVADPRDPCQPAATGNITRATPSAATAQCPGALFFHQVSQSFGVPVPAARKDMAVVCGGRGASEACTKKRKSSVDVYGCFSLAASQRLPQAKQSACRVQAVCGDPSGKLPHVVPAPSGRADADASKKVSATRAARPPLAPCDIDTDVRAKDPQQQQQAAPPVLPVFRSFRSAKPAAARPQAPYCAGTVERPVRVPTPKVAAPARGAPTAPAAAPAPPAPVAAGALPAGATGRPRQSPLAVPAVRTASRRAGSGGARLVLPPPVPHLHPQRTSRQAPAPAAAPLAPPRLPPAPPARATRQAVEPPQLPQPRRGALPQAQPMVSVGASDGRAAAKRRATASARRCLVAEEGSFEIERPPLGAGVMKHKLDEGGTGPPAAEQHPHAHDPPVEGQSSAPPASVSPQAKRRRTHNASEAAGCTSPSDGGGTAARSRPDDGRTVGPAFALGRLGCGISSTSVPAGSVGAVPEAPGAGVGTPTARGPSECAVATEDVAGFAMMVRDGGAVVTTTRASDAEDGGVPVGGCGGSGNESGPPVVVAASATAGEGCGGAPQRDGAGVGDDDGVGGPASVGAATTIADFGLPDAVVERYADVGVGDLFPWQAACLLDTGVLRGENLVYCAPTSGGKTLIAEVAMVRRLVELKKKKVMYVVPYVAMVTEKVASLTKLLEPLDVVVGTQAGGKGNRLLLDDVAVCTMERANGILNTVLEMGRIEEVSLIVVDELHQLADRDRGYLLEVFLAKALYAHHAHMQVIGMSATLPNAQQLATWLKDAWFFATDYRPVPLTEAYVSDGVLVQPSLVDPAGTVARRDVAAAPTLRGEAGVEIVDRNRVIALSLEAADAGHSVLIFCPSKKAVEATAGMIARYIAARQRDRNRGAGATRGGIFGDPTPAATDAAVADEQARERALALDLVRTNPCGCDPVLEQTLPQGVAYHHAGLTHEEREVVEACFRGGAVRVLTCTTTLAAGVNLPARRVLFLGVRVGLDRMTKAGYKQAAGRAGRAGLDTHGESIVLTRAADVSYVRDSLIRGDLRPAMSNLSPDLRGMTRAIGEAIFSGIACTALELRRFAGCTFYAAQVGLDRAVAASKLALDFLERNAFILWDSQHKVFTCSLLATATFKSGLAPEEAVLVQDDLSRARRCFVMSHDLHLVYHCTPYATGIEPDWGVYYSRYRALSREAQDIAGLVGLSECELAAAMHQPPKAGGHAQGPCMLRRWHAAMVLHEIILEKPLADVSRRYGVPRGHLQRLMSSAAAFCGMTATFAEALNWWGFAPLIQRLQLRLRDGVENDLVPLMQIPNMKPFRARALYRAGYRTAEAVARGDALQLEAVMAAASPFAVDTTRRQQQKATGVVASSDAAAPLGRRVVRDARRHLLQQARDIHDSYQQAAEVLGVQVPPTAVPATPLGTFRGGAPATPLTARLPQAPLGAGLLGGTPLGAGKKTAGSPTGDPVAAPLATVGGVAKALFDDGADARPADVDVGRRAGCKTRRVTVGAGFGAKRLKQQRQGATMGVEQEAGGHGMGEGTGEGGVVEDAAQGAGGPAPMGGAPEDVAVAKAGSPAVASAAAGATTARDFFGGLHRAATSPPQPPCAATATTADVTAGGVASEVRGGEGLPHLLEQPRPQPQCPPLPPHTSSAGHSGALARPVEAAGAADGRRCVGPARPRSEGDTPAAAAAAAAAARALPVYKGPKTPPPAPRAQAAPPEVVPAEPTTPAAAPRYIRLAAGKYGGAVAAAENRGVGGHPAKARETPTTAHGASSTAAPPAGIREGGRGARETMPPPPLPPAPLPPPPHRGPVALGGSGTDALAVAPHPSGSWAAPSATGSTSSTLPPRAPGVPANAFAAYACPAEGRAPQAAPDPALTRSGPTAPPPPRPAGGADASKPAGPAGGGNVFDAYHARHYGAAAEVSGDAGSTRRRGSGLAGGGMVAALRQQRLEAPGVLRGNQKYRSACGGAGGGAGVGGAPPAAGSGHGGGDKIVVLPLRTPPATGDASAGTPDPMALAEKVFLNTLRSARFCGVHLTARLQGFQGARGCCDPTDAALGAAVTFDGATVYYYELSLADTTTLTPSEVDAVQRRSTERAGVFVQLLEDRRVEKVMYAAKDQLRLVQRQHPAPPAVASVVDPRVAAWLLSPDDPFEGEVRHTLETLYRQHLRYAASTRTGIGGSIEDRACRSCAQAFTLMQNLNDSLRQSSLDAAFRRLEMPFVVVLAALEHRGMFFDTRMYERYERAMVSKAESLEAAACAMTGYQWSLFSPQDCARALFDNQGFPEVAVREVRPKVYKRKRAETRSTSASVLAKLEELKPGHPLPAMIREHRMLTGWLTKYIRSIPQFCNASDSRVRALLFQTATNTGRLACTDPNLQTIPHPVDFTTVQGSVLTLELRTAFRVPPGRVLVSADYSQIEVRIMAHFSQDPAMIAFLTAGGDVFKRIAAEVTKKPPAAVTPDERKIAKAICYGILYGKGVTSLSEDLGCAKEDAASFLQKFKRTYIGVTTYIQRVLAGCREVGYVETLFGRKRFLPTIYSRNEKERAFAERMAVNTVCQGSAADIVKHAMVHLHATLPAAHAVMVLQIHDELLFEVDTGHLQTVLPAIKRAMETCVTLRVPTPVTIKHGPSWGELVTADVSYAP